MRSTSIWPIGGFAGWVWMARSRTTRRSPRTGMAVSGRATSSVACSRACCAAALRSDWSAEGFAVDASLIKADANRQKGIEGDKGLPPEATGRAIDEYLAVLDDAAFGAATEVTPKFVSPSDPAARWTGAHGGQAFFAYSTNYLVDIENAIIVDVEATTAIRQAEVLAAKRMIERSMERFDLYPARLMGDSAYGSAEMLGWLVHEHGIEPHVTVFDKSARTDGTFSRHDFTYDHAEDVYRCPAGKVLTTTGALVNDGATMLYLASKRDCDRCALKSRCCPKQASRRVPRSIYEG